MYEALFLDEDCALGGVYVLDESWGWDEVYVVDEMLSGYYALGVVVGIL